MCRSFRASRSGRMAVVVLLVVTVVGLGGWVVVHVPKRDPYRNGSSHRVSADCSALNQTHCWIQIGPPDHPQWSGETDDLSRDWIGQVVPGTLHIVSNWGTPSATFEANGQTVKVWGGKPDGHHAFAV
jgi:hypothetical protein